ncbi:MAG: DUF397 domain-containing protein [Sciscionella sp.]
MSRYESGGIAWRTSSYSGNGGECVEVGWHTSSHSANGGGCVEVRPSAAEVLVRDSKSPHTGTLTVNRTSWRALLASVRSS